MLTGLSPVEIVYGWEAIGELGAAAETVPAPLAVRPAWSLPIPPPHWHVGVVVPQDSPLTWAALAGALTRAEAVLATEPYASLRWFGPPRLILVKELTGRNPPIIRADLFRGAFVDAPLDAPPNALAAWRERDDPAAARVVRALDAWASASGQAEPPLVRTYELEGRWLLGHRRTPGEPWVAAQDEVVAAIAAAAGVSALGFHLTSPWTPSQTVDDVIGEHRAELDRISADLAGAGDETIVAALEALRVHCTNVDLFPGDAPASEGAVATWEADHSVPIPSLLRSYLRRVTRGGGMPYERAVLRGADGPEVELELGAAALRRMEPIGDVPADYLARLRRLLGHVHRSLEPGPWTLADLPADGTEDVPTLILIEEWWSDVDEGHWQGFVIVDGPWRGRTVWLDHPFLAGPLMKVHRGPHLRDWLWAVTFGWLLKVQPEVTPPWTTPVDRAG